MTTKVSRIMVGDDARLQPICLTFDGNGDYTVFLSSPYDFEVLSIEGQCGNSTSGDVTVNIASTPVQWTTAAGTTLTFNTTASQDSAASAASATTGNSLTFTVSSWSGSNLMFVNLYIRITN